MKRLLPYILSALLLVSFSSAYAQTYSLQDCIDLAISQNLRVKQQQTQVKLRETAFQEAKDARLPVAQASVGQGLSFGRSIDPSTNVFASQSIGFNSIGVNASYTIFNAGIDKFRIQEQRLLLEASQYGIDSEKQRLTLQVILAYTQLLAAQELVKQATAQSTATEEQLQKTQKLIQAGILPGNYTVDLKAQLANNEYEIVNAVNQLNDSRLQLSQLTLIPNNKIISVLPLNMLDMTEISLEDATTIYQSALKTRPEIKAIETRISANAYAVKQIKAGRYPTVMLTSAIGTNYSSAAREVNYGSEMMQSNTGAYVITNGSQLPVFVNQQATQVNNIEYGKQLSQNLNGGFSIQVKVPIGNKRQINNKSTALLLEKELLRYEQKEQEQQLIQGIEQAMNQQEAARGKYIALQKSVSTMEGAFQSAKKKLDAGTINAIEYTQIKSSYDRVSLLLIQAKYEWLMRRKIVDFYRES